MKHRVNGNLTKGSFRVVCSNCSKVYIVEEGDINKAGIVAMKYSDICDDCHGEVILETNPKDEKQKYDKDHPYPQNNNC
jgi:hypothetical protein